MTIYRQKVEAAIKKFQNGKGPDTYNIKVEMIKYMDTIKTA